MKSHPFEKATTHVAKETPRRRTRAPARACPACLFLSLPFSLLDSPFFCAPLATCNRRTSPRAPLGPPSSRSVLPNRAEPPTSSCISLPIATRRSARRQKLRPFFLSAPLAPAPLVTVVIFPPSRSRSPLGPFGTTTRRDKVDDCTCFASRQRGRDGAQIQSKQSLARREMRTWPRGASRATWGFKGTEREREGKRRALDDARVRARSAGLPNDER